MPCRGFGQGSEWTPKMYISKLLGNTEAASLESTILELFTREPV